MNAEQATNIKLASSISKFGSFIKLCFIPSDPLVYPYNVLKETTNAFEIFTFPLRTISFKACANVAALVEAILLTSISTALIDSFIELL